MPRKKKEDTAVIAFKGFNPDFTCRGFQYEVGKEYEQKGTIQPCYNGFHACKMPLDVFEYYNPANNGKLNKFALVEQSGTIKTEGNKQASSLIKIKSELSFMDLVKFQIDFIKKGAKPEKKVNEDYSVSTNTGYYSVSTNTGYKSVSTNTGDYSVSTNTGNKSVSTNTGYYSVSTNTGDKSVSTNTGYYSVSTNTGYYSVSTNTGDYSVSTNTGDYSVSTNTGDYSVSTNTGDYSVSSVEKENSAAFAFGIQSKAKAVKGWIIIVDWQQDEKYNWFINDIHSAKVGQKIKGKKIKPNMYYWFENGELKEEKE